MILHQITKRAGEITRVRRGETPTVEITLEEGQYVASVTLETVFSTVRSDRVTVDWQWTAYVVTPLP